MPSMLMAGVASGGIIKKVHHLLPLQQVLRHHSIAAQGDLYVCYPQAPT